MEWGQVERVTFVINNTPEHFRAIVEAILEPREMRAMGLKLAASPGQLALCSDYDDTGTDWAIRFLMAGSNPTRITAEWNNPNLESYYQRLMQELALVYTEAAGAIGRAIGRPMPHEEAIERPSQPPKRQPNPDREKKKENVRQLFLQGLNLDDISQRTGIPYSTVKQLKAELVREGRVPPPVRRKKPKPDSI